MVKQQAYQKLADAIATDFIENQIPLNDSALKVARTQDMTNEQICRLCEATNNTTFNRLFKGNKEASDRIVEFDVADSKTILGQLIKDAEDKPQEVKTASVNLNDLKDEMYAVRHPEPEMEKTASTFELRPEGGRNNIESDQRTIDKTRNHLYSEKLAFDMQYRDKIDSLRGQFRRLYNSVPFETFEKQAVALYNEDAIPHLAVLRDLMNKVAVEYNVSKIEKHAGYVDDSTIEFTLLKEAMEIHKQREAHITAITKLENL